MVARLPDKGIKRERCQISVAAHFRLPRIQFGSQLHKSQLSSHTVTLDAHAHSMVHSRHSSTEETDPRTTLCKAPCSMTQAGPEKQPPVVENESEVRPKSIRRLPQPHHSLVGKEPRDVL